MKKILVSIVFTGLCIAAGAQTMADALNLGSTNYFGTARTIGLGNAVTAVGGDLGTIAINPAGSAVAGYSQFTITPGVTIFNTGASWAPSYNEVTGSQAFSGYTNSGDRRFILPNLGLALRFETGRRSGLKSWTFGLVSNMTNNFNQEIAAGGKNGGDGTLTSMAGSFALGAQMNADGAGGMLNPSVLDMDDPYTSSYYWNYLAAYGSGLINYNYDALPDGDFYGANEYKELVDGMYNYFVPGELNQYSSRTMMGSKNDITMNFGFNVNDNLFLGFNFTFPTIDYRYTEQFRERAVDPSYFIVTPEYYSDGQPVIGNTTTFEAATYRYDYSASVAGINAAVGAIWLPTANLRLGASVKTPTAYTVSEEWRIKVNTDFSDNNEDGFAETPWAENTYNFRSPWSINLGAAYTFGTAGMISADYEMTDFSVMKFSSSDDNHYGDDSYYYVNRLNNLFCGTSHSLRLGAELRVLPFLALRAGYNITTNPERYYTDSDGYTVDATFYDNNFDFYENGNASLLGMKYLNAPISSISCGLGYVSAGSFFADLAVRRTSYPESYFSPYSTYLSVGNGQTVISPCVAGNRRAVDAVLTLGWRF